MTQELRFLECSFINFEDRSYRWVDLKRFSFSDPTVADAALLGSLIVHARYRDVYCSANSHERDSETIHGPYLAGCITPDAFDMVSRDEALAVLDDFCSLSEPPTAIVCDAIDRKCKRCIRSATSSYRLQKLEGAGHDFSFVLEEFRELVLVDRILAELTLVVMAID